MCLTTLAQAAPPLLYILYRLCFKGLEPELNVLTEG